MTGWYFTTRSSVLSHPHPHIWSPDLDLISIASMNECDKKVNEKERNGKRGGGL